MLRSSSLRLSSGFIKNFRRCASTSNPAPTPDKPDEPIESSVERVSSGAKKEILGINISSEKDKPKPKSNLVSSAFASLQHNATPSVSPIDESILQAKTPEELLTISKNAVLTKKQAIKIVTTLSEWSLNGKFDDFESDPRFVALCRMVSKTASAKNPASFREGDLSVVLGVMGEDEAAKMINSITLPQMIKVLSSLSFKRRRSIPLLKALAFNIGSSTPKLDVKQSADVLYAIASLNFPDEVLLEKVCSDLLETIPQCKKSAVIGSVCTSIGLLRYKDLDLLDSLCAWAVENKSITRPQDFVSLLLCLASVKRTPPKEFIEIVLSTISENELPSALTWLDVVWSLAVLESAPESHISSVLRPKFVERLSFTAGSTSISWKRKLLNINGLAKLTKGYKGPFLKEDTNFEVPYTKSKDKQVMFTSLIDTLSNLFPSSNHFRTSVDTGMGFLIDAECMFDTKNNPVPLVDKKTGETVQLSGKRVAFFICDYHDCTRGQVEPCGSTSFQLNLVKQAGYSVIPLMYSEYNPQNKLLDRAKYIDGLLKSVITAPT